jgi:hypothetical protein
MPVGRERCQQGRREPARRVSGLVVQKVLRRWLELRSGAARASGYSSLGVVKMGATDMQLWCGTVASALANCPHNLHLDQWLVQGSGRRRTVLAALQHAADVLAPETVMLLASHALAGPSGSIVSPPLAWVELDVEASALEQAVGAVESSYRRGSATAWELRRESSRLEEWHRALDAVEGARATKVAMEWLGERFRLAAERDPSFLRLDEE